MKRKVKHSIYGWENIDYNGDCRFKKNRYKGDDKRRFRKKLRIKMDNILKDEIMNLEKIENKPCATEWDCCKWFDYEVGYCIDGCGLLSEEEIEKGCSACEYI